MNRPGAWLRRIASRVCDDCTMIRVIDPIIADLQCETDTSSGLVRKGWIRFRAYVGFWTALALCIWHRLTPRPRASTRPSARRAAFRASLTALGVTALLVAFVFVASFSRMWSLATPGELLRAFAYLIPGALPFAIPLSILVFAIGTSRPTTKGVVAVVAVACIASAISAVLLNDVIPEANQAFSRLNAALSEPQTSGRIISIPRGAPELRWSELRQLVESRGPATPLVTRFHYHLRPAFVVTPMAFALLGICLTGVSRHRRRNVAVMTSILFLAYFTAGNPRLLVRDEVVGPALGAWLPNIAAVSTAVMVWALHLVRRRAVSR